MKKRMLETLSSKDCVELPSAEATEAFGRSLATRCPPEAVICLHGDLGAGKTTLIKGLVAQAAGVSVDEVVSPTFMLLQVYADRVAHFDLYRLADSDEFLDLAFDEQLAGRIACIEWAERIDDWLPETRVDIYMEHSASGARHLRLEDPKQILL